MTSQSHLREENIPGKGTGMTKTLVTKEFAVVLEIIKKKKKKASRNCLVSKESASEEVEVVVRL